jgi:lysophospholipase L1-like esterase
VKVSSLILFVSLALVGCTDSAVAPESYVPTGETPTPDSPGLFYLALGDSYTIGESVTENERYPVQLGNWFRANSVDIEVRIIAATGWTTQDLAYALNTASNLRQSYDLVSLLIGVNNQYQGRSLENYRVEFRGLLERAVELAGNKTGRVFVISIPDYAYTPFGGGSTVISQEIDAFNDANRSITAEYGIQYFDITPISREGLIEPSLVAEDGLHPSGLQYSRWVELMVDVVQSMLEQS